MVDETAFEEMDIQDEDDAREQLTAAISGYWGVDGRCIYCGAGDDNHHSWSCPTDMHLDKQQ